ncbi:MAG: pyridoxal phosphate-dependent aminotransferase [Candidatus Gracilibacteria bacterium]|jgi:aspartate/methionine/tyrosine aminotransferase
MGEINPQKKESATGGASSAQNTGPFVFQVTSALRQFLLERSGENGVDFSIGTPPTSEKIRLRQLEMLLGCVDNPFREGTRDSELFWKIDKMIFEMGRYETPGGRDLLSPNLRKKLPNGVSTTLINGGLRKALELWQILKRKSPEMKELAEIKDPIIAGNEHDLIPILTSQTQIEALTPLHSNVILFSNPLMERCSLTILIGPAKIVSAIQGLHTSLLGTPSTPQEDLYELLSDRDFQKYLEAGDDSENGFSAGAGIEADTEKNDLGDMIGFLSFVYSDPISALVEEAETLKKNFSKKFLHCFFEHLIEHEDIKMQSGNGGGRQALHIIENLLIDEGVENMLLFKPHWTYNNVYTRLPLIGLPTASNGQPNLEALEEKIRELTQDGAKKNIALTINSPNNPSGVVYSQKTLTQILQLAEKYGIYLIDDACYIHILRQKNNSATNSNYSKDSDNSATLLDVATQLLEKGQLARTTFKKIFTAVTASKGLGMAGARLGGIIYADDRFTDRIIEGYSHELPNILAFYFANKLMDDRLSYLKLLREINAEVDQRVLKVTSIMDQHGIEYKTPAGAFYLEIKVPFLAEKVPDMKEFALKMAREKGIAFMPMEIYGGDQYSIRLSLGGEKQLEQLQQETEILITQLKE